MRGSTVVVAFAIAAGAVEACSSSPQSTSGAASSLGATAGGTGSSGASSGAGGGPSASSGTGSGSGSGWYPMGDAGTSAIPVIPSSCTPSDAYPSLGPDGTVYACPTDVPKNCPLQPPPQGYSGPDLYWCPNSVCVQGCADVPCPDAPCPASTVSVWTCGPGLPDVEQGCTLIASLDAGVPLGGRYTYCCPGSAQ